MGYVPSVADLYDGGRPGLEGPQLELDQLLMQLVDRAHDVMATQDRMRALLVANRSIFGHLGRAPVLRSLVEAAVELVDAKYGALGVIDSSGTGLEEFIHTDVPDGVLESIGRLPEGRGLLGALIRDPSPRRLHNIAQSPDSVGFPAGHPAMSSFLGVPVLVREEVFGVLYLTRDDERDFTADDEELVVALAATAGVAIENARLYEEAQRRQLWLETSNDVTRRLLSGLEHNPRQLIAETVNDVADADIVVVLRPGPGEREGTLVAFDGTDGAADFVGTVFDLNGSPAGQVMSTGEAIRIRDVAEFGGEGEWKTTLVDIAKVGPLMVLPLNAPGGIRCAVVVGRRQNGHPFLAADMAAASTFVSQAAVAWELADARENRQKVVLLEERARIARDLHDHVIQQLFASGMALQGIVGRVAESESGALEKVVDNLDDAIKQIRVSIFQLRPGGAGMRSTILETVNEVRPALSLDPQVVFQGPVDTVGDDELARDAQAVVREALTNVAKHAHATRVDVLVRAQGGELTIQVTDNGVGISDPSRRSGLDNMERRAAVRGGSKSLTTPLTGTGTSVVWTVPIP